MWLVPVGNEVLISPRYGIWVISSLLAIQSYMDTHWSPGGGAVVRVRGDASMHIRMWT
jgi:hypothetical protein